MALKALQAIDSEVWEIERTKKELETRVRELTKVRDAIVEDLGEKKSRLKEAEDWYKEKNAELEEDKRKIAASKNRLTGVKKNKEYQAIMKEIEALRKANEKKDEEILKLLEAIERFRESTNEQERKLGVIEEEIKHAEQEVAREVGRLEEKIAEKAGAKTEHVAKIPSRYLNQYKRVFTNRNGVAVVAVVDGTCSGCNMRLQPQLVNTLLRRTSIHTCPTCSRFLYVESD